MIRSLFCSRRRRRNRNLLTIAEYEAMRAQERELVNEIVRYLQEASDDVA